MLLEVHCHFFIFISSQNGVDENVAGPSRQVFDDAGPSRQGVDDAGTGPSRQGGKESASSRQGDNAGPSRQVCLSCFVLNLLLRFKYNALTKCFSSTYYFCMFFLPEKYQITFSSDSEDEANERPKKKSLSLKGKQKKVILVISNFKVAL